MMLGAGKMEGVRCAQPEAGAQFGGLNKTGSGIASETNCL
jgi:hypothetical protein